VYQNEKLSIEETGQFTLITEVLKDKPFKILQLTDIHFGFGPLSKKQDAKAMADIRELIRLTDPDYLVLTGDSIFPYIIKSGTLNNIKQAHSLIDFLDDFKIPYSIIFGNHDIEMGAKGGKNEISEIFESGKYSVFSKGDPTLNGMGNYMVKLASKDQTVYSTLVFLDSNMYRDGWFYSGFDCIREDQTKWCMASLSKIKSQHSNMTALAFFHMPLPEFKEAYAQMKLGNKEIVYNFGSIGESDDYFGISKYQPDFFESALENKIIKGMFCGHDHYNTLSLTYKGIMMTYGMSIDYLGYKNIHKKYIQRGGTLITLQLDSTFEVKPVPLNSVVSTFVRGK